MRLASSEAEGLEIPFSEEEVFAALSDLGKDKAPGPNGFTMAFWMFCWDVVKIEIMDFFKEFHERGRFVKSLNATFLVLVLKKGGAEDLKYFRPISLVGSLYKLLAKVLANRIKKVMGKVISESQNAFVKGLKINLEKSELIPVGRVHDIEGLTLELGCKVGGLPSCYLGFPLGAPFKSMAVWDEVKERFRRRLAMWKRKVRLRLEKIQRDFLWGGGALIQKPHLVRWNLICLDKKKGVLEASHESQVWRRGERMAHLEVSGRYGVGLWKAIRKEWLLLDGRLAYHVSSGQRVRFWTDKRCGDEPLCESFSLFSISLSKNAWVSEIWNPVGEAHGWTPFFARAFNDWEIELVELFLHKIQAFRVQREDEDRVI
ncbi:Transposon TX1 uncharacterized 149 kDa protein [Vitis vinifera]|uniref:Transposon TX1 uncharacterized 149 kDa protein n=1 Tax=Vitis vinifera TaxID=29760 RepID=A0A438I864_VITVI|nr:Transposon TX1 uncharacterized 149 kDa protein [Vitis vinifera]